MKRLTLAMVFLLGFFAVGCQVVSGGNYTLRNGQTLSGDLAVIGGNSTLDQGSRVTGSVWVTGGNINANGQIDGDVSVTGGNIDLGPGAVVKGAVSKIGGNVDIAPGAMVQSAETSTVRNLPRWLGNLAAAVILVPLLVVVTIIVLLSLLFNRGPAPQRAAQVAGAAAAPSTSGYTAPAGRGSSMGGLVAGIILIGLGVVFLLEQVLNLDIWRYVWPLLILISGLICFAAMIVGGKGAGRLAIPGSILTMLGLLLLYQNAFDLFQTWAYAWALIFPTSIGIGHLIEGWWSNIPEVRERGLREFRSGLILFLIFAAFFELVLNLSGFFFGDLSRYTFPVLLILLGLLLLIGRFLSWPGRQPAMQTPAGSASLSAPAPAPKDQQPPAKS